LALGLAAAASLSLAGCFQSKTKVIEVGDDAGLPSKAFCITMGNKELAQLPKPERASNGGTVYRDPQKPAPYVLKKINKNLYLAQVEVQGKFRYGYLWRDDKRFRLLTFPLQMTEGTRQSAEDAGLTISSSPDGYRDLTGKQADLERFLLTPEIDSLTAVTECSFEKPADWGPPLIGQIRKNFTREDVLSMVGATECGEEVCFYDLGMAVTDERSLKKAHREIRLKFSEHGVDNISIQAQDLDLGWENRALNQSVLSLFPITYSGDESSFVFLRVNNDEVLYPSPDAENLPEDKDKRLDDFVNGTKRRANVSQVYANKTLKFVRMIVTDAQGIEKVKGTRDVRDAIAKLEEANRPYVDYTLERGANGLFSWDIKSQH
jgi:hypothetical protein